MAKQQSSNITNQKLGLPQVTETRTPQLMDVAGEFVSYDEYMTRVYIADAKNEERSALRLVLLDLKMEIAGESSDWATTLILMPDSRTDILLIDWDLLPNSPTSALDTLRKACPAAVVIILLSHLDARQQAALSAGADAFISKSESPERVAEHLRSVAAGMHHR